MCIRDRTFTPEETKKFMLASTFGVPMKSMKKYLDLPQDQQDAVLKLSLIHIFGFKGSVGGRLSQL